MIKDNYDKATRIRLKIQTNTDAIAFWVNSMDRESRVAYLPPNFSGTVTTAQKTPYPPDPDAFQAMRTATIQALERENAALETEFANI